MGFEVGGAGLLFAAVVGLDPGSPAVIVVEDIVEPCQGRSKTLKRCALLLRVWIVDANSSWMFCVWTLGGQRGVSSMRIDVRQPRVGRTNILVKLNVCMVWLQAFSKSDVINGPGPKSRRFLRVRCFVLFLPFSTPCANVKIGASAGTQDDIYHNNTSIFPHQFCV